MRNLASGSSPTIPRIWTLGACPLLLLVLLLAGGCGGNGDRLAQPGTPAVGSGDAETEADIPASAGLPGLPDDPYMDPETIAARRGNYLSERTLLGDECYAKAESATVSDTGHLMQLIAGEREPSWAVYRFDDLLDEDAPLVLSVKLLPHITETHYLGLADYTAGQWHWREVIDQQYSYTIGIPSKMDLVSPGGSVYVALMVWDSDVAVVLELTLGAHVIGPPPVGLEASDGGYGSRIVLTWEDPAITYPGLEYDAVQIERFDYGQDIWELIAEVPPGVVEYSDVHDGADNYLHYTGTYRYRLRTIEEGVVGPPGPEERGYRKFPPVTGVSATDGEYFDKVVITWDTMAEADGYVIDEYGTQNEPWPLATVTGGNTTSFAHTAYFPEQRPAEYGEVYKYAVLATHMGDYLREFYSETDDSADTGYRILKPPTDVRASDGDHPDWIVLSWSEANGATGYKIYRDGFSPENVVATVGDDSYWYDTAADFKVHTYRIRSTNCGVLSEFSEADDGYRNRFVVHEVDEVADSIRVSLALIDGRPAICYYVVDYPAECYSLKFAQATTATPQTHEDWDIHVVDSGEPYGLGQGCCLAVIDGSPAISYIDNRTDEIMYARALTGTPSVSDDWFIHAIAAEDHVYGSTRLMEVAGTPAVCYDNLEGGARFARATTATPASNGDWLIHSVPGQSEPRSLIMLNGKPALASMFVQFSRATATVPSSSEDWETHRVSTGSWASLAALNGRPAITHSTAGSGTAAVHFAYAITDSPRFSSDWLTHEVSREHACDWYSSVHTSLAVIDGRPAFAWSSDYSPDGSFLRFAWASTAAPTTAADWEVCTVREDETGSGGWAGISLSLAELNSKPIIAYGDGPFFAQGQ